MNQHMKPNLISETLAEKFCPPNYWLSRQTKTRLESKKGAFYYKLNTQNYKANFQAFLNIIPNSHLL